MSMDESTRQAFYGCWGGAGHFMYRPNKANIRDIECEKLGFPKDSQLDGSRLFLPYPEIPDHGRLTYLPALNLTILSWWNRVFDTRGAVNSHFMYRGEMSVTNMWHCFEHFNHDLWAAHKKPFIGVTY